MSIFKGANIFQAVPAGRNVSFREPIVTPSSLVSGRENTPYPVNAYDTEVVSYNVATTPVLGTSVVRRPVVSEQIVAAPVVNVPVLPSSAPSAVEESILRSVNPAPLPGSDVVTVNGQTGVWTNRHEAENWRGEIPLSAYAIHNDPAPQVIRKKPAQNVLYNQNVAVRYLNPPTPPPHGDIVIKEQPNIPTGPAPPVVIRQEPPRPVTPPTLVVREAPPAPPQPLPPKLIQIPGKRIPPPPRKVVVEKLPVLPPKPQNVLLERWLPYKEQTRRVIYERNTVPDPIIPPPKNLVIQWESPDVTLRKDLHFLGVVKADPHAYVHQFGPELKHPNELPHFTREIRPPNGITLAAEHRPSHAPQLVGDVAALNLIDLNAHGLNDYGHVVSQPAFVPPHFAPQHVYAEQIPAPFIPAHAHAHPYVHAEPVQFLPQNVSFQSGAPFHQYGSFVESIC